MDRPQITHLNMTDWQSKFAFSQAVSISGPHRRLLLAGVGSEGAAGTTEAAGDVAAQCRMAWASILETLAHEGGSYRDIVRVRTYVLDPRSLPDVTATRREVFGDGPYPIHTFLVVSALAQPGMLVEIEVEAALPE